MAFVRWGGNMRKFLSPLFSFSFFPSGWLIFHSYQELTAEILTLQREIDPAYVPRGPGKFHNNADDQIDLNQYK